MTHSHGHGQPPAAAAAGVAGPPLSRQARREEERLRVRVMWLLAAALIPMVAALVAGVVILWPHGDTGTLTLAGVTGDVAGTRYVTGRTVKVVPFDCQGVGSGPGAAAQCAHVTVAVTSGPDAGKRVVVDVDPTVRRAGVSSGDELRLARYPTQAGLPPGYAFVDFTRSTPMWLLAVTFAVLVVVVARWRGLAALVGLGLSIWVLLKRWQTPAPAGYWSSRNGLTCLRLPGLLSGTSTTRGPVGADAACG